MLAATQLRPSLRNALPDAHVRRATDHDLDALVALEQSSFAVDRMSERQWHRHLGSLSADVLVVVSERRIVGAAVIFRRLGSDIARLYSIAVAASERGNGIGAVLLDAVEQAAHRQGSRRLRLEVRSDNVAAQRLYESSGYRLFGAHQRYYEDGQDARRYEKALASKA
ncbi:MAG: GNAT family N-acetyltransferase [Dokdonella sp.]